ncbi:MAG: universal stress protein [Desulfobacteraceae bacterium]|nr:MAG: universal stress protein [Desulfobacteraceae bacterium]
MKFKKILFPTKFRELDFNSLESLLELKAVGLEEVILTYIIPREEVAFVPYGGYLKDEEERLREEARIRFEDWQESISKKGIKSTIRIEVGEPTSEILSIAEEEKVDLIVAGRGKRTETEKVHVGSHTLDLIRRARIPILVSKYMVLFEREGELITFVNGRLFANPLLATDWSKPSENALEVLFALKGLADKVMVTHIIEVKVAKGHDKSGLEWLERESKKRLKDYCDRLKNDGIKAEPHLSSGKSAPEIVRVAREHKASMIVMGTTGKDRFKEFWLGSVSHRVAETSEIPVLLVP